VTDVTVSDPVIADERKAEIRDLGAGRSRFSTRRTGGSMGWFDRAKNYDRTRILEEATRARAKKRRKKAIALYRRLLAVERHNAQLHATIAPLLAESGQRFDAWVSFQIAAQACLRDGRGEKVLMVYREAARYLPREIQVWQSIAQLQAKRGKKREAVEALIEGASQFGSRRHRPQAIHLLRRAHEIERWDFEAVFELARLLGKSDQIEEARRLLEGLEERYSDRLRRLYAAQFQLEGDLRYAWRWLRAPSQPEAAAPYGRRRV
jgi:tetratricopeptide (TPR) repeat protein